MTNPGQQPQRIDFKTIKQNLYVALQKHFDLLAYNLANSSGNNQELYDSWVKKPRVMPFPPAHLNFEQIEAFSQDIFMRNFINDVVRLAVSALDHCFIFCNLIHRKEDLQANQQAVQQEVQQEQNEFAQKPLHDKFDLYEKRFGFMTEYEDALISLGFCLQSLVQNNGTIAEQQTEDGELLIELKQLSETASPEVPAEKQLSKYEIKFKTGDKVTFKNDEFQLMLITMTAFFNELFGFVEQKGKEAEGQ